VQFDYRESAIIMPDPYLQQHFWCYSFEIPFLRRTEFGSDFCFFAPQTPDSLIADTEGEEVAYCVKKGHGARGVPPGTFTGLQILNNPNYVQIVGLINQQQVNIKAGDFGGELDSGGQDEVRAS
jgi:hypothetical protein